MKLSRILLTISCCSLLSGTAIAQTNSTSQRNSTGMEDRDRNSTPPPTSRPIPGDRDIQNPVEPERSPASVNNPGQACQGRVANASCSYTDTNNRQVQGVCGSAQASGPLSCQPNELPQNEVPQVQ